MIYQEKTRTLRKGLFEVQNEVGLGRQEEGYHQAYRIWLADNGIPFASKPPHPLMLSNDFNIARGKSFMEALSLEWGIAVNFGKRKAQFDGLRHRG